MSRPAPERCNIRVYCAVQDHSKAAGADFTLLLVMARWADDDGICWPSIPSLAKCCHVSERSIQATIARLIATGELKLLERGGGSHDDTNKYQIVCALPAARPVKSTAPVKRTAPVKSSVVTGEVERQAQVKPASPKEPEEKNQEEARGGGAPPPPPKKPGNAAANGNGRKLWPAGQPDETTRLREKYAEWWTTIVHHAGPPWDAIGDYDPPAQRLMQEALHFVGGPVRIHDCRKRPKEASFARDEFLKYLCRNDPAYEGAVAAVIAASLVEPERPKTKAASGRGRGG